MSGKRLPGKVIVREKRLVREIIDESGHAAVRETCFREKSCPGNVLYGKCLSGKVIVRETSVTRLFNGCSVKQSRSECMARSSPNSNQLLTLAKTLWKYIQKISRAILLTDKQMKTKRNFRGGNTAAAATVTAAWTHILHEASAENSQLKLPSAPLNVQTQLSKPHFCSNFWCNR